MLGSLLSVKGNLRAGSRNKKGKGIIRAGIFMPPHPLTKFEIQKFYQNEDGTYMIDRDQYPDVGMR